MKNIKNIINQREELIKSLAILKVKKYLSIIDEVFILNYNKFIDIYRGDYIENFRHN